MIDPDTRNAIYKLHQQGMSLREIGRRLNVNRNTVATIVRQQGVMPQTVRKDKIAIDEELLRRLYHECEGWIQRVYEKLVEEEHVAVSYTTVTRLLRELGISKPLKTRCERVPDEPGAEMQHDTTVYQVPLAGKRTKVIASSLYLRYSKRKYLRFYRVFNRFAMKCFLHEALMFWGYSALLCIIDNTNLARLRGTGSTAVIVPEMEVFSARYSFRFVCHALRHANRKAGEERSFWTVETNFLKGRTFESLEDMNAQALEWATVRMEQRPVAKTGLIPAKAFEHEQHYLTQLPAHLPAPYRSHGRGTDQYGYVAFAGNYYWVPGEERAEIKVLEYADHVKLYRHRECLAEYPLPANGVKNERFSPPGQPQPRHLPKHRKNGSEQEEKRLRALGEEISAYVDYAAKTLGSQRHRFLRALLALSRQVPREVFVAAVGRALRYRVLELQAVWRIAWFCMNQGDGRAADADVDVDENFHQRAAYQEGCLTDEPDLSIYDSDDNETPDDEESSDDTETTDD